MILAEKVASLRKKKGWSQEELAEKLGISRQSVSKWESGASIPDIDKIIMLSELFQVSTDYLLKDEMEESEGMAQEADASEEPVRRSVSLEEANTFMALTRKNAIPRALAVALFVLCPTPLILLAGMAEDSRFQITEEMAMGAGLVVLLVLVAVGVTVLILCGRYMESYAFLDKEIFTLQYGVEGITKKNKESFAGRFHIMVAVGVALCILGVVPLVFFSITDAGDFVMICGVVLLLVLVAAATFLFVWAGSIQNSFHKLLQSEEFSPEQKTASKKLGAFSGAYWCVVTAFFLVVYVVCKCNQDYLFDNDIPMNLVFGMIWGVAGLFYAAARIVLKSIIMKNGNGTD
ncbi:MAG: helix-turn-helix domain-containing protein [Blautia sp.]|nr:helix-turn-helix domain-containing protein [Blautia sp.]